VSAAGDDGYGFCPTDQHERTTTAISPRQAVLTAIEIEPEALPTERPALLEGAVACLDRA
jgi:hypothetical protein